MKLVLQGTLSRPSGFVLRLDVALECEAVTAVVGQSGAGKSTLLRAIAGLEPDAKVSIVGNGAPWHELPAHARPVSMVFQQPLLFPHLSVRGNLCFPRQQRPGFSMTFDQVVDELDLGGLLSHFPGALSGGEQQRVALARALLAPAKLWLFDEPLSALDARARADIAPYLARLCREHRVPILYVTHALEEVLQIADQMVIIENGSIVAHGSVGRLAGSYHSPLTDHDDAGGILECQFVGYEKNHHLSELRLGESSLWVRGDLSSSVSPIRVHIPARNVGLSRERLVRVSILNQIPGIVEAVTDEPPAAKLVTLNCEGQTLLARITALSAEELDLAPGQQLFALIKSVALRTL